MLRRLLSAFGVILAGTLIFLFTILLFFPFEAFEGRFRKEVADRTGLVLSGGDIKKVFPFGLEARGIRVFAGQKSGQNLYFDRIRAVLAPLSIFSGKVRIAIDGDMGEGRLDGALIVSFRGPELGLNIHGLGIEHMALPETVTVVGDALFNGRLSLRQDNRGCLSGRIRMDDGLLNISRVAVMGMELPMGRVLDAGLDVDIRDCTGFVRGLWAEGEDLSIRLKGKVSLHERPFEADLRLEVVTEKDLSPVDPLFILLSAYRRSSNYYSIPIKGSLERFTF